MDAEADESECDALSSDDEDGSDLDAYDNSFINDCTQLTQEKAGKFDLFKAGKFDLFKAGKFYLLKLLSLVHLKFSSLGYIKWVSLVC